MHRTLLFAHKNFVPPESLKCFLPLVSTIEVFLAVPYCQIFSLASFALSGSKAALFESVFESHGINFSFLLNNLAI